MIYLMMGIPASGKSTYAKSLMEPEDYYISRDEVRFSIIKDEDEYFSKEKEVFNEFLNRINTAIDENLHDVWIDATHISKNSRDKLVNKLHCNREDITVVFLNTPLDICLERNNKREGRAKVPESAVHSMAGGIQRISADENFGKVVEING